MRLTCEPELERDADGEDGGEDAVEAQEVDSARSHERNARALSPACHRPVGRSAPRRKIGRSTDAKIDGAADDGERAGS
jgi:hypothetical protein